MILPQIVYFFIKEVLVEEFRKGFAEDITIYVFYGYPAEVPRRSCDKNNNNIYFIRIKLILSSEYEDFEDIFFKKECETVLGSTRITYIIDLKQGIESPFKLIYSLSERELRILHDYFIKKEIIN